MPPVVMLLSRGRCVVRDDLVPGGTKSRVIDVVLKDGEEFVYASPVYGYAQVALAHACTKRGLYATIFTAARNKPHPRTLEAKDAGAVIINVPHGYLSNVQAKARQYVTAAQGLLPAPHRRVLLPWGLDTPEISAGLVDIAKSLGLSPSEVWCAGGSGTLTRALQTAWPGVQHHAVRVGAAGDFGNAIVHEAEERFEDDAKQPPPFPSCSNYDAKVWRFFRALSKPGALFWNVAK